MKFLDLTLQYCKIKKEINQAIQRVLDSGIFINGSEVEALENEIAKFCNLKYVVSLNSGTDALMLSLKAFDIGVEDEVVTTPFTFIATAEVIAACGAIPVFVDIDPKTFNIDVAQIEQAITKKTKAIIPVHLFGKMADMNAIMQIAKKYNLKVIEDACQAIGAEYYSTMSLRGAKRQSNLCKKAGSIGDCGCFSFFPTKNLGAYGDGGMVVTNNTQLANKIRLLRNHGSSPKDKYLNLILGTNSRLDAIQAAILRVKLKYLNQWNKKRIKIVQRYNQALKSIKKIQIPITNNNGAMEQWSNVCHQYTIRCKQRNALKNYLDKHNIPTMIYFPRPLHLQPALKYLGYKRGDFPEAEKAAREVLSLPIYPELSQKNQEFVIRRIKQFYE